MGRPLRILVYDVETAPIVAYCWSLWDNNVALNQIVSDWHLLSWSAKWMNEKKVMYSDSRGKKNVQDDKHLLKSIWPLLDEADIVVTQNGIRFDQRKLNARFVLNGINPPSPSKHIDTLKIAKKHFGFTSNKLEYMTDKLCKKNKKLKHKKYPGFELWKGCLNDELEAWKEMEKYNKADVLSLEELYLVLRKWDQTVNFNLYHDDHKFICSCGSSKFKKKGYHYTAVGKFQRFLCLSCGQNTRGSENIFSKAKRRSLRRKL